MHSVTIGKKNKISHVNMTYHNSVDKDIQSMFQPLNIMLTICFCPKYRIKNNSICPNSHLLNILSVCGNMFFIAILLIRLCMFHSNETFNQYFGFLYIISYFHICFYSIGFILNYFLTIIQVRKNINFVMTIQRIHRFFNNKRYIESFTLVNWIYVLCLFLIYIFATCFFYVTIINSFVILSFICFDVNIIYAIRCIAYLKEMLCLWNDEISRPLLKRDMNTKHYCKAMLQTYMDILSAFDTFKSTFKYFVSNCTGESIIIC